MKTISRYIMTLALLITAVGGAWAQTTYTVAGSNSAMFGTAWDADNTANDMTKNGDGTYSITYTNVYLDDDVQYKVLGNHDWENAYPIDGDRVFNIAEAGTYTVTIHFNPTTHEVYETMPGSEPADVEVTTNADKTEASFNMPANDVTAEYELVRDLAQQTSVNLIIGTGDAATPVTADTRLRIVKNNNVYVPISALSCTFSDEIENNTILPTGFNDAKLTPQFYLQGENDAWTLVTDINTTTHLPNNLQPGQVYCMTLKAAEGSNYDGETPKSFTITLFQGYEVTVGAGEYATFYKDEALCVEDDDAELYTISEVNATEAVLSDAVEIMPKNTPMLIFNKGTEANTFLLIPTTEDANAVTAADQFQGTLDAVQMPASTEGRDYYVCTGKAFVWVKSAGTIAANRCWLEIIAQPAGVRANTRSIVSGGDTTNIDATTRDALEGDYYDLQGRKVEKPLRKGVYIKSGKKVIKH